jgi:hypothetical protein
VDAGVTERVGALAAYDVPLMNRVLVKRPVYTG